MWLSTTAEVLALCSPHSTFSPLLKAHLRAQATSPRLRQQVPSNTDKVVLALGSTHLQEAGRSWGQARSPGTWGLCLPISRPLFVHRHTWGPHLKAFQTEEKKSASSAGREVAGVWIASPRLKDTLLLGLVFFSFSFLQETKFSEFLLH